MKIFFHPDYTASSVSFDTTRKAAWIKESLELNPIPGVEFVVPELLVSSNIRYAHSLEYVEAIKTGNPRHLAESSGLAWNEYVWKMSLASSSGLVAATKVALNEGVAGSLSSGFHHACKQNGKGFCTFNGLAIAAFELLMFQQRPLNHVLILDLDAHCGGGTYSFVYANLGVVHLDISVDRFDTYTPWHLKNKLVVVEHAEDYLPSIVRNLDLLEQIKTGLTFDLCLYNAGMDPFEKCRIGGLKGITKAILEEREKIVFSWLAQRKIPVAFVPAGGYINENFTKNELVDLHRLTIEAALQAYS